MFCVMCGAKLDDNAVFCTSCGARQEARAPQPEPVAANAAFNAPTAEIPVIPHNAVMTTNWKQSFFDGSLWGLIGVSLLTAFVSLITLGLAAPGLTCYRLRWIYKHTCIGGYRLKFTGRGWPLFGKYLLWFFLTVITIGIYGFWVPIKYKKWEISHVEIDSVVAPNP